MKGAYAVFIAQKDSDYLVYIPDFEFEVGDKVDTYILKFNPTDKRIALTVNEEKAESNEEYYKK